MKFGLFQSVCIYRAEDGQGESAPPMSGLWRVRPAALVRRGEGSFHTSPGDMGRKGGVPDRWEDYSAIGSVVPGTRFVAFKVPLKPQLLQQVGPSLLIS